MVPDPLEGLELREKCGIIGAYDPSGRNVVPEVYYGLLSLQHRGQDSAGITVASPSEFSGSRTLKTMGLLSQGIGKDQLETLSGSLVLGHVRYSTSGGKSVESIQPFERFTAFGNISLGHNGHLTNAGELRRELMDRGVSFNSGSDTEVFLNVLISLLHLGVQEALLETQRRCRGAYSIVLRIGSQLFGMRDRHGIRPLLLGSKERESGETHFLVSETCALDAMGATCQRDLTPGEIVLIDSEGVRPLRQLQKPASLCAFEYIYFARSDSRLETKSVDEARYAAGALLYEQDPRPADVIFGVPDSGLDAALGYAEASGIPLRNGIVKNRYVLRTFIESGDRRKLGIHTKFNVIERLANGKSVLIIDDSLVRGNTSLYLVQRLRSAGAKEIHFRSASPLVSYPCFYGIDFPSRTELISYGRSKEDIARELEVDSLDYLTLENLRKATGRGGDLCSGCFTGIYPGGYFSNEKGYICEESGEVEAE